MKKTLLFLLLVLLCFVTLCGCDYQDASYYHYTENEDGTLTIISISETYSKKLEIPSEIDGKKVTAIGNFAFYNNDYIRKIVLPDSVLTIGECAFADCNLLNTVTLGKNCEVIGLQAFEGCNSLEEITLSQKLTTISDLAFNGCLMLKEIDPPKTLTTIGVGAFDHCEQLTMVTEHSDVAAAYAEAHGIPTGFAQSDGYMFLKLGIGIVIALALVVGAGHFFKKRKKKNA